MCFTFCPRCQSRTLEFHKTHQHCIDCNYCPDLENDDPSIDLTLEKMIGDLDVEIVEVVNSPEQILGENNPVLRRLGMIPEPMIA